ncbi:hypothetical protein QC764_123450 [Podospora pseudoanserina]|uniref:Uncharacterized protein n=1 Tax=Podospora pseudoanserina TaxID=2609844 RepID=A0ABR0IS98_9PEZI|nr:hypothetical protein QC764_123450 [Podospora pseudoanserina]
MLFTILLLLPILGCAAERLFFHRSGDCWDDAETISCRDIPASVCCQASDPWCGVVHCEGCPNGSTVAGYFQNSCQTKANGRCEITHPFSQEGLLGCCVDLGPYDTCAGQWYPSSSMDVATTSERKCVQPNVMTYVDHDHGVKREIHIPQGELKRATQLLLARDFGGLRAFENWAHQSSDE